MINRAPAAEGYTRESKARKPPVTETAAEMTERIERETADNTAYRQYRRELLETAGRILDMYAKYLIGDQKLRQICEEITEHLGEYKA
jgi:hypothetical protein